MAVALATALSAFLPAFSPDALPWIVFVVVATTLSLALRRRRDADGGPSAERATPPDPRSTVSALPPVYALAPDHNREPE